MADFIDEPIDAEEAEIMRAVNSGEYRTLSDEEAKEVLAPAAKNITIRMKTRDIDGMKAKDLKLAESIVEENKTIFEVEWKKFFKGGEK